MKTADVLANLKRRFPNEPEYHQAVEEVLLSIEDVYNQHPEFDKVNLIERLCIPDRIILLSRHLDGRQRQLPGQHGLSGSAQHGYWAVQGWSFVSTPPYIPAS